VKIEEVPVHRGGYIEWGGEKWWSANLLKRVEVERDAAQTKFAELEAMIYAHMNTAKALEIERDQWREKFDRASNQSLVALAKVGELGAEVNRLRGALALLAGRVPQPPDPPDAIPLSAFGSASYVMLDSMVKKFAGKALDGDDPTAPDRKYLVDQIVEGVRQALVQARQEGVEAARKGVVPQPPPRYDETFHEGLEALEEGESDPAPEPPPEALKMTSMDPEVMRQLLGANRVVALPSKSGRMTHGFVQMVNAAWAGERDRGVKLCEKRAEDYRSIGWDQAADAAMKCAADIRGKP